MVVWCLITLLCIVNESVAADHPGVWVLQLKDGVDPEKVAQEHHLVYNGPVKGVPHFHLFELNGAHPEGGKRRSVQVEAALSQDTQVTLFEAQDQKKRYKRNIGQVVDPLYSSQWHLRSVKASSAWPTRTGKGVNVAIVDDGVQWRHPDLMARHKADLSIDLNDHDSDPTPSQADGHGTSAAGAAVASANSVCGVGVAPEAGLAGIRLIAAAVADYEEAQGLSHKNDKIHIYSSSWGPYDDGRSLEAPGSVTKAMFQMQSVNGRNGLGSVWVWAGGNGRDNGDNCNYDGYANSRFTLAIGAVDHRDQQAWYSESCAALIACAPSSGALGFGITTTDLMGSAGYSRGDCTTDFGGTSAAAPIAAGAIALLLEERPDLSWRDVQHVIAKSSRKLDERDPDWNVNALGYHHNHKYGFGMIDVENMLRVAREHQLVPKQQKTCSTGRIQILRGITGAWVYVGTTLPSYQCRDHITFVEHVELTLYISHPRRGEVAVHLTGPDGTISVLAERHGDTHTNYPTQGWTFTSMRHFGSPMIGPWTINLQDASVASSVTRGKLEWYELKVHGY